MGITASKPHQKQELHDSCRSGDLQTVTELIKNKVNINQFDENKLTPLHLAVSKGHAEIVQLLLENRADINIKSGEKGLTPLIYGAIHGKLKIMNILIDFGADMKLTTDSGRNALHYAAGNGHDEIVEFLIENGITIDALDYQSSSPLHLAAVFGKPSTVQNLISKGANKELQGLNNRTPLLSAVFSGNIETAEILLDHGANVNAVDKFNSTAMHFILLFMAEETNDLQIFVKLLINYGADLTLKDEEGRTVLDLCKKSEIGDFVIDCFSEKKVPKITPKKTFTLHDCIICTNPRQDLFALYPCAHADLCESCCMKLLYSKSSNMKCYLCCIKITDYNKIYI